MSPEWSLATFLEFTQPSTLAFCTLIDTPQIDPGEDPLLFTLSFQPQVKDTRKSQLADC